ncbi:uncharacterized protein LOC114353853 [Ostrinia furnacalis]|uniref:uncharacterized protein LOC114353853 n=1 Tax=Ostrinia furnacalis TaxID=93504 RepID=UPI00103C8C69|nr:uncharacterized protein LOC114353853 [Ostrinia furnacalis]
MLPHVFCVFACVVFVQSTPIKGGTVDLANPEQAKGYDHSTILKELARLDGLTTEKVITEDAVAKDEEKAEDKDGESNSRVKREDKPVISLDNNISSTDAKNNTDVGNGIEDVKDRPDIDTILTVFNNKIGISKKYYFKNIYREVNNGRYKCKIGITTGNVIFYYRCILESNGISGEGLIEAGEGDMFDIA